MRRASERASDLKRAGARTDGRTHDQGTQTAGVAVTRTCTVTNNSDSEWVAHVLVSNSHNVTATPLVDELLGYGLLPGATGTFDVSFTPNTAGAFQFDLTLDWLLPGQTDFNISVTGEAAVGQ